jgi:hypothetical protein
VLQAPLQKINLQSLLAHLPFQFRYSAFRPALFSMARKRIARTLAELPTPTVQHVRIYLQPSRHFSDRYPLFQPPDGRQFKLLRELPA